MEQSFGNYLHLWHCNICFLSSDQHVEGISPQSISLIFSVIALM
jgi:hypothetical protein